METHHPLTLQDLCIRFVSLHLDVVESFVNFPDVIGQKIFDWAAKEGQFHLGGACSESTVSGRLQLFSDAYKNSILSSMCLSSEHLLLNGHFGTLSLFKHLTTLDVSNCGLGDGHELLHHVSKLERLQTLSLAGNALSDHGVRQLTTPCRILQTGPLQLLHLDLSDNLLTSACLKFLPVFYQLQLLCLQFDVQKGADFEKFLETRGWEVVMETCAKVSVFKCQTQGWARGLLDDWKSSTLPRQSAPVPGNSFYKKRRTGGKLQVSCREHGGRKLVLQSCLRKRPPGAKSSQTSPSQPGVLEQDKATKTQLGADMSRRSLSAVTVGAGTGTSAAGPWRGASSCENCPPAESRPGGKAVALEAELESDEDRDLLAIYSAPSGQGSTNARSLHSALNLYW